MQVYRGMDIGTAKPNTVERRGVPHHMLDIVDPSDEFSVAEFRRIGRGVMEATERPLIITGGSGLHFRALVDPMSFAPTNDALRRRLEETKLDELVEEILAADRHASDYLDLANQRRVVRAVEILRLTGETPSGRAKTAEAEDLRRYVPQIEFTAVGVDPGEGIDGRIKQRLSEMRGGGFVEEVAGLESRLGRTARSAVGYREILDFLDGAITEDEAFDAVVANTRRLARKQRTWFQRDPRIRWLPWIDDPDRMVERALEAFE